MKAEIVSDNSVIVYWQDGDSHQQWNDACIWAVEKFGLPGKQYSTRLTEDYMEFNFGHKNDALMFLIGIS